MAVAADPLVRAASLAELRTSGRLVVRVDRHTICLFADGDEVFAVDNRCPHMGFPVHRGTVCDCILTCHRHHARFDLSTGGTFDQWADDLRRFPVELRGDEVFLDVSPVEDVIGPQRKRLHDGLERNIPLVLAKAILALMTADPTGVETFRDGLDFGVARRGGGWSRGLTTLTCFMNLLPSSSTLTGPRRSSRALQTSRPTRPVNRALPARPAAWFGGARAARALVPGFVEVRDTEEAERALVSAVRAGASSQQLADMLFAAATDHRYLDGGHTLDFVNKALEALDVAGWEHAEAVLASLPTQLAGADRMEEANAWRNPVDLVALLDDAFAQLPDALAAGAHADGWTAREALVDQVLGENPAASINALLTHPFVKVRATSSSRLRSPMPPSPGSPASRRRTSSATGTRPCTPSPSPTRSSRAFAVRLHRSSSAACSTLR